MDSEEARRIVGRARPPQFGSAHQIAADRFLVETEDCAEWLSERNAAVMMAGLQEWFQLLDIYELVEIENLLWQERKSRRH